MKLKTHPPQRYNSVEDWRNEAKHRFGSLDNAMFVCPSCGEKIKATEWKELGHPSMTAFSCIGRLDKSRGCDYAGGGLFQLNPVSIDGIEQKLFAFQQNP